MFIPPYDVLLNSLGISREAMTDATEVTIPAALFKKLLSSVARASVFDEAAYLAANPDVRGSVTARGFASAREHYADVGYFEARYAGTGGLDVDFYRNHYPDVPSEAEAATHHYHFNGAAEWRAPSLAARMDVMSWRVALHIDAVKGTVHPARPDESAPDLAAAVIPTGQPSFWTRMTG